MCALVSPLLALWMFAKTRVVNIKFEPCDVNIMRPGKWGNRNWKYSREINIALFETDILERPDLLDALTELVGKRLGCACKPKACHGDVLVRLIRERFS